MATELELRRIRRAREAALRERLTSAGLPAEQADRWISTWTQTAGQPETQEEFDAVHEWVLSELARERKE